MESITGRGDGGRHILFKYQDGVGSKELAPGIDIKSDGGYIVAAPSIHPESGKRYEWELSSRPLEVEINEAPKWLLNMIIKPKKNKQHRAKPVSEYLQILQGVEEGNRNNSMMTLIGHLLSRNIHYAEAFEIVHMWNESRVNPPLPADIVTKAFNNILRRESEKR